MAVELVDGRAELFEGTTGRPVAVQSSIIEVRDASEGSALLHCLLL